MATGPLEPGARDRIVTIQQRSATDEVGTTGVPIETWTTLVAQMPAERTDLAGRELYRTGQLLGVVDTQWRTNYRRDLDPELMDVPKVRRILHNGRIYDIVAAEVIDERRGLQFMTMASTRIDQ